MHFVAFGFEPLKKSPDPIEVIVSLNNGPLLRPGQKLKGAIHGDALFFAKDREVVKFHSCLFKIAPWFDGPLYKREGWVRYNEIRIHVDDPAKTPACVACPHRAVK